MMIDCWGQLGSNVKWIVLPEKGGASAHAYLVDCTLLWNPETEPKMLWKKTNMQFAKQ